MLIKGLVNKPRGASQRAANVLQICEVVGAPSNMRSKSLRGSEAFKDAWNRFSEDVTAIKTSKSSFFDLEVNELVSNRSVFNGDPDLVMDFGTLSGAPRTDFEFRDLLAFNDSNA